MPTDPRDQIYVRLAQELTRNGVKASLQNDQLMVATALPPLPDSSNSFWLRFYDRHWYLVTWAPRVYRLPDSADVIQVSLACLRASAKTISTIPEELIHRYQLTLLDHRQADAILE
jgi:hypothetical protein